MKYLILFLLLFTSSCIVGPKSERKSKLSYLNGELYENSNSGSVSIGPVRNIPVIKRSRSNSIISLPLTTRKNKRTSISGSLNLIINGLPSPLNRQELIIKDTKGMIVAKTFSHSDGSFKINKVLTNGSYTISIKSNHYKGSTSFEIISYEIKNLNLLVKNK